MATGTSPGCVCTKGGLSGGTHTLAAGTRCVASVPACGQTAAGRWPSLSERPRPPPAREPALQRSVAVSVLPRSRRGRTACCLARGLRARHGASHLGAIAQTRRPRQRGKEACPSSGPSEAELAWVQSPAFPLTSSFSVDESPRLRRKGTMLVSRRPPASLLRMQCRGSSPVTQLCNRHLHLVPEHFSSPRKDPRARPHLSIPASRRLTTCNLLSASVGSPILDASH